MHGYTAKSIENDPKIDHKTSKSCTMSSEFEALCFCYQRPGNYIEMHKGKTAERKYIKHHHKYKMQTNEDINHITVSCPMMSKRYYIPLRHDVIEKIVYNALIHKNNSSYRKHDLESPKYIHKEGFLECWGNNSINTATKILHNKPDPILWDRDVKICQVIQFSCPADINVSRKVEEKVASYGPLIRNLQKCIRSIFLKCYQLWLVHSVLTLMSPKKV